jgi:Ras GTPase-activating-like protein IQGAP2/3
MEEELRNGVVLAKLTRQFAPHLVRRIFESPRLQFRHSENINYFFRFLDEIGVPDLFTFELTDLYDKKNIPKVIYCVHALGYILHGEGVAPPIGDLVGKLEFTDDELQNTQRGLDASGVNLPNFGAMNRHFGEPQVPQQSAEELREAQLKESEDSIVALQALCRGALVRYGITTDLYTLQRSNVVKLQAFIRGSLIRQEIEIKKRTLKYLALPEIIALQSLIRGGKIRQGMSIVSENVQQNHRTWNALQAHIRGHLIRQRKEGLVQILESEIDSIIDFQSTIRGIRARAATKAYQNDFSQSEDMVRWFQCNIRGYFARKEFHRIKDHIRKEESKVVEFQSALRAHTVRTKFQLAMEDIEDSAAWVRRAQAIARGHLLREKYHALKARFSECEGEILDIQSIGRGYLTRQVYQKKKTILNDSAAQILQLQNVIRAGLLRRDISQLFNQLGLISPSIIRLQSIFRGVMLRFSCDLLVEELEDELPAIIALQAQLRGFLVRRDFNDRMSYFRANMDKVIKIQSFVRAKKQGDAYKSLITGQNPPVSTVKSFIYLLNDSDLDFEQELELEQARKKVIDEVRNNELLEQFINQLDVKIALLLKNKITLDELVRHRNKGVKGHMSTSVGDIFDLKALNKASRKRLELYQGLFYIVQTQSGYLARLFQKLRRNVIAEKEIKDIEGLVMTIFGYAQKRREEFFLLQLIGRSIREDMEISDSPSSFMRGNFIWWRLVFALSRGSKERKQLRELLVKPIETIVDRTDLDLESDPSAIYRTCINNEELRTGKLSQRNPNLPVDEAIQDPETRQAFITNLQNLRECSDDILNYVENGIDNLPYHIRYIAREVFRVSKVRFPQESEDKRLALVGHVIFANYLCPAITAADNYGILKSALGPLQTKNLNEVTKMLCQISSMKPFSKENVYLQPLNDYVKTCIARMRNCFKKIINVPDIESEYGMNVFDDLTSHRRPTLYIKSSDIFAIQSLLCQELSAVAPEEDDSLRDVLKQLGSLPNDASDILNIARFTEVKLDLNPIYCRVEDPQAEVNSLFVAAKRCMLYILRVQTGGNLLDILVLPVMQEHEEKYRAILNEERIEKGKKRAFAYSESILGDLSRISYRELKLLALEKMIELESFGRISRDDNYQEILNSIALDIKNKHDRRLSRQKDMEQVHQTLTDLSEKEHYLQNQLQTYNNYIEQAMATLQTKKGKKKGLVLPFTKQYFHMRDLQKSGRVPKFGSYKYSASSLFEKGVLVELNGYSERQYSQVTFTFSSDQVGVFTIEAAYGSITLPGATVELTLDDLLGQQYNNKPYLPLFDDMVKFNTNLTLHFIFKKFYGDN